MTNIIRAYYFLFHVGLGCVGAFLPTYLKTEGFTGTQISSIVSLGALCGLVGVPLLWGWISDRLQKPQLVLKILAFGTFLGSIPLLFLRDYWLIFASFLVYSFCSIGIMGILDAIASTRAKEQKLDFGRMRLFAPAGWFLGSVLLGFYLDLSGKAWNDIAVIIAIVLSFGLMFLNSLGLKHSGIDKQERPSWPEIRAVFKQRHLIIFFIMAAVNIIGIAAYWVYYGPLVESLGMSASVVGLSIGVGTLSEVIFMFFFDRFRKWLGLELLIILSIGISILRWLIIAHTSSAGVLIGIQVLHSEIGLFTLACVTYVTDHMPKKLVTTGQTVFYTLTYGVGQYIGIMLMGSLFDYFGNPAKLFVVSAFIHLLPLAMAIWIMRNRKQGMIQAQT